MKQFKNYGVIILLLTILIVPSVALAAWWNPFSWNIWQDIWNSIFYKPVAISVECVKAKDCQDIYKNCYYSCSSNKCVKINTFVALKPYPDCSSAVSCKPNCNTPIQQLGKVVKKVGDKEFNFLIQKINANSVDGLSYILYPVAMLQGQPKTLHVGDTVGYACEGKTAALFSIDVVNQTVIFNETIKNAPRGGCPI